MDFQEVWMNTDIGGDHDITPQVLAAKTCFENLKTAEDNCIYLLVISIFLLILNVLSTCFFNRQTILAFYRSRFHPLPGSETASSVFRGAFDHDEFDMKG
uniref:Small integral membrane protein 2 n=1 Tax=Caenorhabditis tropicalis TaxID=1561998 RepID=A0A1I7V337_9PELO